MSVVATFFAACLAASAFGQAVDDESFELAVRNDVVRQGDPVLLVLRAPENVSAAVGRWLGRDIVFSRDGQHLVALAAVDRNETPGEHEITISVNFADGTEARIRKTIPVRDRSFPTQDLRVDPRYVTLSAEDLERVRREQRIINAAYESGAEERLWRGPFVKPAEGRWSAPFGVRRLFNGEERSFHSGSDIAVPAGTPVLAGNSGRVALAMDLFFGGNTVLIDHGLGVFTGYMHLSRIDVTEGQEVGAGQVLGLSGATGRVTGPHLHWMLRIGGVRCDAAALLSIDFD